MTSSSWPQLFNHPLFRKGWTDHASGTRWTEEQGDSVVYIFGRMMAAESRAPLPKLTPVLTAEMTAVIHKCPAFEKQMTVSQWLQTHGDPSLMDKEVGTKQGDA